MDHIIDRIYELEEELRLAILRADVESLEQLFDDSLMFVVPGGLVCCKEMDLTAYRTGAMSITCMRYSEHCVNIHGNCAIVSAKADISGNYCGEDISGSYRYLRVWTEEESGWKISGGSVCRITA